MRRFGHKPEQDKKGKGKHTMKKTITIEDLWDFVYRADTPQKIRIAEEWLERHVKDFELLDNLMHALSIQSRNYYRAQSGRELI